jgi:hypothetical protein
MGTGDETAASRLRQLRTHFRQHPVTGPEGHSYVSSAPRSTPAAPAAPAPLHVVDHIHDSVQEVIDDTLAANPDAGPLPERVEGIYLWSMANTRTAEPAQQQRRDTIIYRQALEHAIAMGDTEVIRPHRCPACRTFGLFWRGEFRRAVCTNRRCLDDEGLTSKWTLAQLAFEHVAARNSMRVHAT